MTNYERIAERQKKVNVAECAVKSGKNRLDSNPTTVV